MKRALGQSGLMIEPFVLGGNVFGWTADEATSFAVLDAFVDEGFNAIDTLAWGAIGHALGYFALATNSLSAAGFDAKPF